MGKKSDRKSTGAKKGPDVTRRSSDAPQRDAGAAAPKMKTKEYEKEMRHLHGELVALQEWVKATGAKVCIDVPAHLAGGTEPVGDPRR